MHMRPYHFGEYTLYNRDVVLKNDNGTQRIYFFAKGQPKSGSPSPLPTGYRVEVSNRTGMPYIRKDPESINAQSGWLRRLFN
jgi:hypothetical protein